MKEAVRVGFAQLDISPRLGEEMAGYGFYLNRRGLRHLDPLKARAISIFASDHPLIIVQMDLIGLSKSFVKRVRERAGREWGIPNSCLLLHCTHTHSGPVSFPYLGCGRLSEDYLKELEETILVLIENVLDGMRHVESCVRFQEPCRPIAYARTGLGVPDPYVRGFFFIGEGTRTGIVTHACHPVVLGKNDAFSADYPGCFLEELNAYGLKALFLNEPSGDLDPLSHACSWGCGTEQTLRIYGRDLAAAVFRGLEMAEVASIQGVRAESVDCVLDGWVPDRDQLNRELDEASLQLKEKPFSGKAQLNADWIQGLLSRAERGELGEEMKLETQVLCLGDLSIVGMSGEVFSSLGRRIRQAFPKRFLLLAGTCNGLLGYVPDQRDVEVEGYASALAPRIYGMLLPRPGAGERFADQVIEVIRHCEIST